MMKLSKCVEKVCCFYASDWHLTVMLLPYINKKIEEENKVYMKFENSIEDKVVALLGKLKLKNKENIKNISWSGSVQEEEFFDCDKEKIYIISGSEEYITKKNASIENYYSGKSQKVKIINCYEIEDGKDLKAIIERNDYKNILNTKGESLI